jgi:tetratricopeptide (TPR) repeat protein
MNKESKENKELITIIYFDSKPNENAGRRNNMLQKINDYVLFYSNMDECVNRIQLIKKEKIILVIAANDVVDTMPRIDKIRQIDAVFVTCNKIEEYDQFNEKITGIFTDDDEMMGVIGQQIEIIHKQLEVFSFYRLNQRYIRNLKIDSAEFLWFHVFKYVVTRLPHDDYAKKEMLDASRHYYRDNTHELERIDQFERSYKSEDAIQWYTKNSFVYRLINKALRTEDIEQLYLFRYFIQDLCSALSFKHQILIELGEPITVYRGLRLRQDEFDELVKDEQKLVSMNGYLSTSVTKEVAEMYAGKPTATSDKLSVYIEIECDVKQLGDSVIFAYIASQSNFRDEYEILFDIGATFELTTSPEQNENGVWHLKMIATDKGRELVRKYIDDHLEFSTMMSPKIMFGALLYDMGKYDLSLSYFERLLANPEEEDIAFIHLHIGRALSTRGDRNNEWEHYERAYQILMDAEPKRLQDAALVLINMGVFYFDRNESDRALEYFTRALDLFEQTLGNINTEQAGALLCIGGCYEQKGEYNQALEFYDRTLSIHEQSGNLNHRMQCSILLAKGNAYRLQGKYEDALIQFQHVLDIRNRTLPKQHSEIADCLSMIGKTLDDMNNPSEGVMYSLRALDMYNKTLPSTELVEKSSVLVDIGLAFSSVRVDQLSIKYYRRALAMKKKCLPKDHPDFPVIFEHLGYSYSCLGKNLLGLRYSLRALRFRKRIQTSNHPDIVGSLNVLAHVYSNMGCPNRAMHYLVRAQKILKKKVPYQHPDQISVREQIIRIKNKINKSKRRWHKRII